MPIMTLFYLEKGLSLTHYMILLGILNVVVTICEIPTGIVADVWSRKLSLVTGFILMTIGVTFFLFTVDFAFLALGFVFWGIGESFISGADSALLYDSLVNDGKDSAAHRIIGTVEAVRLSAMILGSLGSGLVVAKWGLRGPMVWLWVIFMAQIVISVFYKEPPLQKALPYSEVSPTYRLIMKAYLAHTKASLKLIANDRTILTLILTQIVMTRFMFLVQRPFAQPYLLSFGFPVTVFGLLFAAFTISQTVASKTSHRLGKLVSDKEHLLFSGIIGLAMISLVALTLMRHAAIGVTALILAFSAQGFAVPAISASLNKRLPSERRAACLSISSAGNHFLGLFLGPLYGAIADSAGLSTSVRVFAYSFGPLMLLSIYMSSRFLRGSETPNQRSDIHE